MPTGARESIPEFDAHIDSRYIAISCHFGAGEDGEQTPVTDIAVKAPMEAMSPALSESKIHHQNQHEALNAIKIQYAESLYASKAPLTYFAKGPLSRARACFSGHDGSPQDFPPLFESLRDMLLSGQLMDKKYKEVLPNIIKDLPFSASSIDDTAIILQSIKKVKKTKKTGLRKNGLFANEEMDLSKWWLNKDLSDLTYDTEDARQECTKTMLMQQKSRETQLQIILMLEALALEATRQDASESIQTLSTSSLEGGKVKKSKKPQDLNTLLDLFVDRLSIWQTMTFSESDSSKGKDKTQVGTGKENDESDGKPNVLHQFCVDVVIPFYGARLPVKTKVICQKLGGPKDPTPKRPKLAKSLTMPVQSSKPGASRRSQLQGTRKTLERVLTDDKLTHRRRVSSFSRSSTEPSLPRMKREASDVPLSAIPSLDKASRRYSQREVDLRATSQLTEAKVKKKARIENELQGAIAVLKKPNARMAVKEFVEAAEQRTADPHSRKPLHPRRNPFAPQVMATPRKDRHGLVGPTPPNCRRSSLLPMDPVEGVPAASKSKVPCSVLKVPRSREALSSKISPTAISMALVERTPSRGPSKIQFQGKLAQSTLFNSKKLNAEPVRSIGLQLSPKLPSYPSAVVRRAPEMTADMVIASDAPDSLEKTLQAKPLQVQNPSATSNCVEATPMKVQSRLDLGASYSRTMLKNDHELGLGGDDDCDDVDLIMTC